MIDNSIDATLYNWCCINLQSGLRTYKKFRSQAIEVAKSARRQGFEVQIEHNIRGSWQIDQQATDLLGEMEPGDRRIMSEHRKALRKLNDVCYALSLKDVFSDDEIDAFLSVLIAALNAIEITKEEILAIWQEEE